MSTLIVCVCFLYMYPSNLRSLTPSKYFAIVDLQTLLYRQFLLIHNQYIAVSWFTAFVTDSRFLGTWNHSMFWFAV